MSRLLPPLPSPPGSRPLRRVLLLATAGDPQAHQLRDALAADDRIGAVALWSPAARDTAAVIAAALPGALAAASHVLLCSPAPPLATPGAPPGAPGLGAEAQVWALRQALQQAGQAYQVLHGPLPTQQARARAALGLHDADDAALQDRVQRLRPWACEKCSDPACEHQLFAALQAERGGRGGA